MGNLLRSVVHWSYRISRRVYFVLLFPLAVTLSVLATAASTVTILISILLCLAYRIVWLGSTRGRLYRCTQKVQRRQERIKQRELVKRRELSRSSDRQIIAELVSIIRKELEHHQNEILANISVLTQLQLQDCLRSLDFDTAMQIYQALTQTHAGTINQRLARQVGLKAYGRWI
ncbi:MAG: hypothetical protein ACU843_01440 [Gammaproteobacteria bacterium]